MGCRGTRKVTRYVQGTTGVGIEAAFDCPGCEDCRSWFSERPMPGQSPETPEQATARRELVAAAAEASERFGDDELERRCPPRVTVPSDLACWQESLHGTLGFEWIAPNTDAFEVRIVATPMGHAVLSVEARGSSKFEVAYDDTSGEVPCRELAERVLQAAVGCGVVRHRIGGV